MMKPYTKGITGSTLKIIAMISMLLDHIGMVLFLRVLLLRGISEAASPQMQQAFIEANAQVYFSYRALRMIGRLAFPIFCFLLVQGFTHTRHLKKYLGRLLLFALVSEIPFDLALSGKLFTLRHQNVFLTLFLGLLAIAGIQMAKEKKEWPVIGRTLFGLASVGLCMGAAVLLQTDYDMLGVLVIVILYTLRERKTLAVAIGCTVLMEISAFASLIPVSLYNGERGRKGRWGFYLFYPLHLLLLYLIACGLGLGGVAMW